jgi:hypothetical protein
MPNTLHQNNRMQIYPVLTIRFPEHKETDLIAALTARAAPPWRRQEIDAFRCPGLDDHIAFHHDRVGDDPSCTLWIYRQPGNFEVVNIVPDEPTSDRISIDQYVRILHDFDQAIADPAAESVGGMS